jgi:hypothetical protein
MNSASALASSVLPTPVGPANRKQPVGRRGSFKPLRLRRTALATAFTACSWLMTLLWRSSSIFISRRLSSVLIRVSGMPVILLTTSAMTSSSTTPSVLRDLSLHSRVIESFFFFSLSAESLKEAAFSKS